VIDGGRPDADAADGWNFFISYTSADQAWAEWIAWQLEDAGYKVLIQAWDFVAGSNWQIRMQEGMEQAQRTVAVLSEAYLTSVYGQAEWQAAHRKDPRGFTRKLLPIRIEDCPRPGLLGGIVSIDLFGHDPEQASSELLRHIRQALIGRAKPDKAPSFPLHRQHPPADEPTFPPDQTRRADPPDDLKKRWTLEAQLAQERLTLGPDHTDTLTTAHNLAITLRALDDQQAARTLSEDTLERRRRTLGPNHTDTLRTANNLANALGALGDRQAARTLYEDTLERFRRTLGPDHALTLSTAHNLANPLGALGDRQAARTLYEDTLERRRRTLGPDHANTLRTAHNLAITLEALGDRQAARTLYEDTLERRRRTLGPDHVDTLSTAYNLANALDALGDRPRGPVPGQRHVRTPPPQVT